MNFSKKNLGIWLGKIFRTSNILSYPNLIVLFSNPIHTQAWGISSNNVVYCVFHVAHTVGTYSIAQLPVDVIVSCPWQPPWEDDMSWMTFRWPWRHLGRHHNSVCVLSGISMETMARIWGWVFRWARGKVTHPCCDMVSFEGIQYIPLLLCIWILGLSFALVTVTYVLHGYFTGILACGLGITVL